MKIWFLLVTMTILCEIQAQNRFDFEDLDQDWLDDSWEDANGLSSSSLAETYADFDGDGLSNIYEFYLETDPNDANDPQFIELVGGQDITDFAEDNWNLKVHLKLGSGNFDSNIFGSGVESLDLIITGGWNEDFSARDVLLNESIIDVPTWPIFAAMEAGKNNLIIDGLSISTTNSFGNAVTYTPKGGENFLGISNCTFKGPRSALKLIGEDFAVSRLLFTNNLCIASEKYGLECYNSNDSEMDMRIYNCTFADQIESSIFNGSGIYAASNNTANVNIDIKNCIIWNNEFRGIDTYADGESFNVEIDYTVLQIDNEFGGGPISFDLSSENIFQSDPELDDDYIPINTSLAIDAGIDLGMEYFGLAPDLGFMETSFSTATFESQKDNEINIYPNPISGNYVNLSIEANEIRLMDLSGKEILYKTGKMNSLEFSSSLPAGTYFLKSKTNSNTYTNKLIILR